MSRWFLIFVSLMMGMSALPAFAKSKIGEVTLQTHSTTEEKLVINVQGVSQSAPELKVEKNVMQVTFPDAYVWPKLEKSVQTPLGKENVQMLAYQYDASTVRVRLVFSQNIENRKDKTFITIKNGQVEMVYPKSLSLLPQGKTTFIIPATSAKDTAKPNSKTAKYDEDYLNQLLESKDKSREIVAKNDGTKEMTNLEKAFSDSVVETSSSVNKNDIKSKPELLRGIQSSNSTLAMTAVKMMSVLALVIGIFFALVQVAKRGMFKKSGLSFLNEAKMVTVLNTTYVGPKRSLITVKVHNQVLLLAQSEAGINFLTEVKGVTELLKEGERQVSGSHFDDRMDLAEEDAQQLSKIKVKENINESRATFKEKLTDKVSFSEQLKNKLKDLKPLQ